jgi:hypothetical protein
MNGGLIYMIGTVGKLKAEGLEVEPEGDFGMEITGD